MRLLPEWNLFTAGVVTSIIWFIILLCIISVYRKEHQRKTHDPVNWGIVLTFVIGVVGSLIILGIMYFFVSVYMYYKGTNTTMHEYLIYLVVINAFWSNGWSIYGIIKYKRKSSPILKSVKITNFTNSLTSIVLTQVVLLDKYAKEYDLAQINGYAGMFVSLVIMFLVLYMIIKSIQKS